VVADALERTYGYYREAGASLPNPGRNSAIKDEVKILLRREEISAMVNASKRMYQVNRIK
jgi:hypothetical protein